LLECSFEYRTQKTKGLDHRPDQHITTPVRKQSTVRISELCFFGLGCPKVASGFVAVKIMIIEKARKQNVYRLYCGSPCWTRTSDTAVNSLVIIVFLCYATLKNVDFMRVCSICCVVSYCVSLQRLCQICVLHIGSFYDLLLINAGFE